MSDWFEHWATEGVKPVFLCEYGAPFTWDWTMYRGWFRDQREFGSARVPWEFCLAEWSAQFVVDRAFPAGAAEQANLRWEARQFRAGNLWHRWDYPANVGSSRFDERYPIFAAYLTDIVLNDSRRGTTAEATWTVNLPEPRSARREIRLVTGDQERWPVRIEKPVRGDFLPVVDGGFDLQYSPLPWSMSGGPANYRSSRAGRGSVAMGCLPSRRARCCARSCRGSTRITPR